MFRKHTCEVVATVVQRRTLRNDRYMDDPETRKGGIYTNKVEIALLKHPNPFPILRTIRLDVIQIHQVQSKPLARTTHDFPTHLLPISLTKHSKTFSPTTP